MDIINGKILVVTVIAIFYALAWTIKSHMVIKVIINTLLGIITIIWVLDFFGIYPYTKFLHINNF